MQPLPILAGAAVIAIAASALTTRFLAAPAPGPGDPGLAAVNARLADLEDQRSQLEHTVGRLAERVEVLSAGASRTPLPQVSDEQVKRAIEDLLQARGLDLMQAVSQAVGTAGDDAPSADLDALFAQLTDPGVSYEAGEELWKKVRDAGMLDEMVARFEALAKAQPDVADAQAALGNAYLQKLFTVSDNEKGVLAMRADRAFDEALDIDPQHWPARFSKAVSLSFWPAFMGRGSEAMKEFGVLIEQQEASGTRKPEFAQTYLFLGNMHEQRGETEKAREIWQRGYDLNPADAQLRSKVGEPK